MKSSPEPWPCPQQADADGDGTVDRIELNIRSAALVTAKGRMPLGLPAPAVERICMAALEKQPEDRPPSADTILEVVQAWQQDSADKARMLDAAVAERARAEQVLDFVVSNLHSRLEKLNRLEICAFGLFQPDR